MMSPIGKAMTLVSPEMRAQAAKVSQPLGLDGEGYVLLVLLASFICDRYFAEAASLDDDDDARDVQLEAEATVLGGPIIGGDEVLPPLSFFTDPWHQIVALAIETIRASGKVPDPTTLAVITTVPQLCADNPLPLLLEMADLAMGRNGASVH